MVLVSEIPLNEDACGTLDNAPQFQVSDIEMLVLLPLMAISVSEKLCKISSVA